MLKEGQPLINEVTSVADVQSSKPSFLLVGSPDNYPTVKTLAALKKAHLNFSFIASLAGQTAGSLLFVEDGKVSQTLNSVGSNDELEKFVNDNSYPLVGQLTPENYQF